MSYNLTSSPRCLWHSAVNPFVPTEVVFFFNDIPKHCFFSILLKEGLMGRISSWAFFFAQISFLQQQFSVYGAESVPRFVLYYHVTLCGSLMLFSSVFAHVMDRGWSRFRLRLWLFTHSINPFLVLVFSQDLLNDIYQIYTKV